MNFPMSLTVAALTIVLVSPAQSEKRKIYWGLYSCCSEPNMGQGAESNEEVRHHRFLKIQLWRSPRRFKFDVFAVAVWEYVTS